MILVKLLTSQLNYAILYNIAHLQYNFAEKLVEAIRLFLK